MSHSSKKKTIYLTTDLDNAERARQVAHRLGRELEVSFPKDLPPPPDAACLVVDGDYLCLDAHGRRQFFAGLTATFPQLQVGVHSYDFDNDQPTQGENGLVVARKFGLELLLAVEEAGNKGEAAA
jgi:hypothetical protein